jgi:malate synthase
MSLLSRSQIIGESGERYDEILTPEAISFVAALDSQFAGRRAALLAARHTRRLELAAGGKLDFPTETAEIRADATWRVAPPAPGLVDRRVEITGPTERKMSINALNSGAKVWLADFEDANSPTWENMVTGQINLLDAVNRRIEFTAENGKHYQLSDETATIVVRPRGLHLVEKHLVVDGHPVSASLFDFGMYLFHCGRKQIENGYGPYFYLPKLESYTEARWWNDVFLVAQDLLGIPAGTIRATTLIETITAAFEMEEILYELREHSSGLNAGRWDYIFSVIKNFGTRPDFLLPDRSEITMTVPFLRAYTQRLVQTCHRRGAHAIGGMAAYIPSPDPALNEVAFAKVREDKDREAHDGFDGSWVAHPGLVDVCQERFDSVLAERANQIDTVPERGEIGPADLLSMDQTPGRITGAGLRHNISVALRYIDSWLRGIGAASIDNLMEDAATAEISRCQVWQWLHHSATLAGGTRVTPSLVQSLIDDQYETISATDPTEGSRLADARTILVDLVFSGPLPEFFTLRAYRDYLVDRDVSRRLAELAA